MAMKKHTLQNAHPDGIKADGVIPDRFFTVNVATGNYRVASENYAISVSKKGPQGMYTAQFAKYQKITQKRLVQVNPSYGLLPRHGKKHKS